MAEDATVLAGGVGAIDSEREHGAREKSMTIGAVCKALSQEFPDISISKIRYLEDHTPLRVHISPLPDYYWPFGVPGSRRVPARALEADPYPVGDELADWADRLVKRGTLMSLGAATTLTEDLMPQTQSGKVKALAVTARRLRS